MTQFTCTRIFEIPLENVKLKKKFKGANVCCFSKIFVEICTK